VSFQDNIYLSWGPHYGGGLTNRPSGTLELAGDFGIYTSGQDYGTGNITSLRNEGTLIKNAGTGTSDLSSVSFTNTTTGVVDVRAGTIAVPAGFINQGLLKGYGTLATTGLMRNAGHVAPGESPGTLTIAGNFAQDSPGALDIDLGNIGTDLLVVTGSAWLDGTLNIVCYATCSFNSGQSFTVLAAASLRGTFARQNLIGFGQGAFVISYTNDQVTLTVTSDTIAAVPEPQTWMTLCSGLMLVLAFVWRRRQPPGEEGSARQS